MRVVQDQVRQAQRVAHVDRAVQSLHAQRRGAAAAQRDRVGTVLAIDVQCVIAGRVDMGVVVARPRVEGCRVEARRVIDDEGVAPAAAVYGQLGEIDWIVGGRGLPVTATLPAKVPSSLSSVQVWPVVSFSSWKLRDVNEKAFKTVIGPWMPAIEPAPPVEPILTVVTVGALAKLEILTGSLSATTLTVLA